MASDFPLSVLQVTIELLCEVMTSELGGQTLVMLFPQPGSAATEQLDLLRVIGTQSFTASW